MASVGFLKQLRQLLLEGDWQPVLSALRQDALVWQALQDEIICNQALQNCGADASAWNPARLGLLKLGFNLPTNVLRNTPTSQLEPELAGQLYNLSNTPHIAQAELGDAMLVALLAREAYDQSNQWPQALADLLNTHAEFAPTTLACLFAIAPDPVALLTSCLTGDLIQDTDVRRRLLMHAILSNPMRSDQRISLLVLILSGLSNEEQLDFLAWMKANKLDHLASPAAARLLGKVNSGEDLPDMSNPMTDNIPFDVDMVYTQAMLQKMSGRVTESKQTLANALDQLKTRQDRLLDALDTVDAPVTNARTPDENCQNVENGAVEPRNHDMDVDDLINRISQHLHSGDLESAGALIAHAQSLFPDKSEFVRLQAELARQQGKPGEAIDALQAAVMLNPDDLSLRKMLAVTYEEQGNWKDALVERRSILKYFPEPPEQELLSLAATAIRAGQLGMAETACQTVLELEPNNGQANATYGELLHAKGDDEKALLHLTRATTLSPGLPSPWLVISRIYRDQGNESFSKNTLKAAAQVLPDSPEIQFALGENCLANRSPSEALVYLRKAYKYDPTSPIIRQRLAENLTSLGLFNEADRILMDARQVQPENPTLLQIHTRSLLGQNRLDDALDAIILALKLQPGNTTGFRLLSELLEATYTAGNDLSQTLSAHPDLKGMLAYIQTSLEKVIRSEPELLELQILSADLMFECGDKEEAITLYQSLLQKLPFNHPLLWRTQFGLGKLALHVGKLDTALVALKEAVKLKPEHCDILKALAETYLSVNLSREALETSFSVVNLQAGDPKSYLWQAYLCLKMNDPEEAATAIEKAMTLEPENPDLILMHARALLAAGSAEAALARLDAVTSRTDLPVNTLASAATLYSELGHPSKTSSCLKKAVESDPTPRIDLLTQLADAYASQDQPEAALRTLDQALAIHENDEQLVLKRCTLLGKLGQSSEARNYLSKLLSSDQSSHWSISTISQMQFRLAELLRESGDINGALAAALEAQKLDSENHSLQNLVLQLQRSSILLEADILQNHIQDVFGQPVNDPDYPLTLSEAALECNLLDEASSVFELCNEDSDPVRVDALKARFDSLAGEIQDARENFTTALNNRKEAASFNIKLARLISLATSALSLKLWRQAVELSLSAHELAPQEPLPALLVIKAAVFEAEENELCDSLKIQAHRPESTGLTAEVLQQLVETLSAITNNDLAYWLSRAARLFGSITDKTALISPPALHPQELAGSIFLLMAAGLIREVDQLMEIHPDDPHLLRYRACALLEHEPATSAKDAELLLEQDPCDPVALALKAWSKQDDAIIAFEAIENALAIWNDEPEWHTLAINLCRESGNTQGRIDHCLELVKLFPDSPIYQLSAGNALLEAGQTEQSINCLRRAVLLNGNDKQAWMLLGQAYHLAGNKTEALDALERAIALDPDDTEPLLLSGRVALAAESFDLAAIRARQILEMDPEEPGGLLLLTGTLAKQGRQEEALHMLESASTALRKTLPVQVEQLMLTQAIKGPKAILDQLETLSARNHEDPRVLKALAECYSAIGQSEEAERSAMEALNLDPGDAGLHYLAGKTQRAKGQLDQAIDHLSEAIRLEPVNVEAYLELAHAYEDRRQYEQAVRVYQQATIVCPDDHRPYMQAGMLLKNSADFAAAEVMLQKASSLAPADMNIHSQLNALRALNFVHHTQDAITRS
ncbi:MAG: tetratricopeptide repeat protein [Anaerolineaceae bacterium]|nr:tetratricopeptide repeat protein [Anaerolineaceae bacterium]